MAILDAAGYGIFMEDLNETITFTNVTVRDSGLDGIQISTIREAAAFTNLNLKGQCCYMIKYMMGCRSLGLWFKLFICFFMLFCVLKICSGELAKR